MSNGWLPLGTLLAQACSQLLHLHAGEQVDMPVFFYIDPEFAVDPKMKGIDQLTLSYTFFKVDEDEEDLDEAA